MRTILWDPLPSAGKLPGAWAVRARPRDHFGWLAAGLCLLATGLLRAGMPPEAQNAVNLGISAAKQEHDFSLAIRYFQEARAWVPVATDAPEIFLNLGLAESRLSGRELRAIGWLSAYLAAGPTPRNVVAVKHEIDGLDVRSKSSLLRLVNVAREAAAQTTGEKRDKNLESVAVNDAMGAGDSVAAMKIASLIQGAECRLETQSYISELQADRGDFAGAFGSVGSLPFPEGSKEKWITIRVIVGAEVLAGEYGWALRTSDLQEAGRNKSFTQAVIAEAQAKSGEIEGARRTANLIQDPDLAVEAQAAIFEAEVKAGETAPSQATLGVALEFAGRVEDPGQKGRVQSILAKTQAQAGDIAGAIQTANLNLEAPPDQVWKSFALHAIAEVQTKAGDLAGAQSTADLVQDAAWKSATESMIAQAKTGTPGGQTSAPEPPATKEATLSGWLNKLDDGDPTHDCALNTPPFLDLAACLKSLPRLTDPQKSFDALSAVVGKIVSAQASIDQMLKAAAQQARDRIPGPPAKASAPAEDAKP